MAEITDTPEDAPAELEHGERHTGELGRRGAHPGTPPGGKKSDKRTGILIALTAAGVLLAWLSFRKGGSSSSATSPTQSSATDPSLYPNQAGGYVAGSGQGDPYAAAGFQEMLSNLSGQVSTLQSSVNGIQTPAVPASPSSGTVAQLHSLAAKLQGYNQQIPITTARTAYWRQQYAAHPTAANKLHVQQWNALNVHYQQEAQLYQTQLAAVAAKS